MNYKSLKSQIKDQALKNPFIEVCGFIIEDEEKLRVLPAMNVAPNKKHKFEIYAKDFLKASLNGDIKAIYHSHPNSEENFSCFDQINSFYHKYDNLIYIVKTDTLKILDRNFLSEYLNKPFVYGESDCYNLVKEYYNKELNIHLPSFTDCYRSLFYDITTFDQLIEFGKTNNFKFQNQLSHANKNNILLFNFYNTLLPPHFAIYLGHGYFLHHPRNGFSQIGHLNKDNLGKLAGIFQYNN